MSILSDNSTKRSVVIVGGGFAGIGLFNILEKTLDPQTTSITLITPRAYFVHLPAVLRMIVTADEDLEDKILLPLTERFNQSNKRVVLGKVASITDDTEDGFVTLENGEQVGYTVLALATGSNWEGCLNFPDGISEVRRHDKEWRTRFANAKSIVLVGGGGIGFELAGEIMDDWPEKKVTIVHSKPLLLNDTYPNNWRKSVNENIEKRGVELVLNDRILDPVPKGGKVITQNGLTLDADLVIPTRGPKPNTQFIGESLGPNTLNSFGEVKVLPTFQVLGFPRIFAIGDIVDVKEQKSARKGSKHCKISANNIKVILAEGTTLEVSHGYFNRLLAFLRPTLLPYPGCVEILPLSNGKNYGTSYLGVLWGITFGDWFTMRTASENLYMGFVKRAMNL
ncbi:hypothetical protein CPB83DRAFT_876076 [Crepidotus variabilis]|uniref:FAD/NAD(P)-binding domain-containing protein n=1 Tax=Crepidotus variabilis TaxID=179855 RepID=A0A9P6EFS2_9AGAR|nr:hypothetical protein CPB83DRAFT_876076 [Crepidotus variabilis]